MHTGSGGAGRPLAGFVDRAPLLLLAPPPLPPPPPINPVTSGFRFARGTRNTGRTLSISFSAAPSGPSFLRVSPPAFPLRLSLTEMLSMAQPYTWRGGRNIGERLELFLEAQRVWCSCSICRKEQERDRRQRIKNETKTARRFERFTKQSWVALLQGAR